MALITPGCVVPVQAIMNPYMPDGPYVLDLAMHDERKVALMLIWLAAGEPGAGSPHTTWTIFQHDGRNHLGLWSNMIPQHGL